MRIFVTGTDTDIGKTVISSWLCIHTGFSYFKPIQTGNIVDVDTSTVLRLSGTKVFNESYSYSLPLSPHLAAKYDGGYINLQNIERPDEENIVIEGAGGLLVPLNDQDMMIDLIKKLNVPVILVARTTLGTINHTLLSLEALRIRNIHILGVILNGEYNLDNKEAIEQFGKVKVLQCFPKTEDISKASLLKIKLSDDLRNLFNM